ncbi:MAG: hypothetical protein C0595_10165 [Marinilabiliales bacterium]|nr:MAG: hypothetical protein C0595_10165 [Marinilabiliales bacterium]
MKVNSILKLIAITVVSMTMIYGSCNKDDEKVEPTAYVPSFNATSISGNVGGVEVIEFAVVCTSNDVNVTKIVVRAPDGNSYTYTGGLFVQNQQMIIPDTFVKLSGTWSFTISGSVSGGTHNAEGFDASASVSVSAK